MAAKHRKPAPQLGWISWDSLKPEALAVGMPEAGVLQGAFGSGASPQPAKGWLLSEAWSRHQFLWRTVWAASSGTSTAVVWVSHFVRQWHQHRNSKGANTT